ncbi:unnamed protein product [Adineta steineri]|uniref:SWIM-type domain-containing protein n=1 Tax=Adineta steineri TaxID=433720 RepID=A0A813T4P2_9BILA|nr:unnamed protein product [Adineta steineri]
MAQTLLFKKILKENDVLILDKGYTRMKKRSFQIKIPQTILKGKTQLSTKQANESRLVTFHRNVVERAIGRLKKWKILQNRVVHQYVPKLNEIVCILVSTINKFDGPLYKDDSYKNKYVKTIMEHINDSTNELQELMNKNKNYRYELVARNRNEIIDFVKNTKYLPAYTISNIRSISTGYYSMKLSERYFVNSINQIKIYEHDHVENCIKVVGIASRFTSVKKHTLILKFDPQKPQQTKFYCSCKSGARTTNPCAHGLCILMLIQSTKKQLPQLLVKQGTMNYHNAVKIERTSSYYQMLYDNIMDCKIYKEWKINNELYCICSEPYNEDEWMIKCSICKELYHPSYIGQIQEEIEDNIDEWKCPYCEEDSS